MGARTATRTTTGSSIGAKITAVVAGLLVVLVASNLLLLQQLASTSRTYDRLLAQEVAQAELSRQMQVEFKKQVQEWKNILLRGADQADRAKYTASFRADYAEVQRLAGGLVADVRDPQARADLSTFREQHAALQRMYESALALFVDARGRDFRTADAVVRGQDRPPTDLLDTVVDRLQAVVDARVVGQKAAVAQRQQLIVLLGGVGVVLLVLALVVVVVRIVRPIRTLTVAAQQVAEDRLPAAVARIVTLPDGAEPPRLDPFPVQSRDELADLSTALTTMQDAAVSLAVEQRRRERETSDMLLNLGRRNQALLARVLSYITELERVEQDPDVMTALFRIDHATTRVRRNAASMLVLAGAPPAPGRAEAVAIGDVVRAALSEIEDYVRVDLYHLEEASVVGSSATDLAHLLAELLENATNFSPPTSRVSIVGQQVREGYRIRVIDQGIGMTREELDAANTRILQAPEGPSDARLLGLYVVGRLADRNGISVRLEASAAHGITASVVVPLSCVMLSGRAWSAEPGPASGWDAGSPWGVQESPRAAVAPAGVSAAASVARMPAPANGSARREGLRRPVPVAELPEVRAVPAPAEVPVVVDVTPYDPPPVTTGTTSGSGTGTGTGTVPGTGVPVRVRGSSLARIGSVDDGHAAMFAEAPAGSSDRLRAFQLDVDAARRSLDTPPPTAVPDGDR